MLASSGGYGFVLPEDEALANRKAGKQVMNVDEGEALACLDLVDEGMDSGAVLLQESVAVEPGDTEDTLAARILPLEHRLLPEALRRIAAGRLVRHGRIAQLAPA